MPLPPLLPVSEINERLRMMFSEGTPNRNYVIREMAAKTVFVMLYVGAVEGSGRWVRPDQVTRMTDAQAGLGAEADREEWFKVSMRSATDAIEGRWYAANTREPIRDETLRAGLVRTGAVVERDGLPTTSPLPRYALAGGFSVLFDPVLAEEALESAVEAWQKKNLSTGALARVAIMRRGAGTRERQDSSDLPRRRGAAHGPGPEFA